jgi:hypothetical protein
MYVFNKTVAAALVASVIGVSAVHAQDADSGAGQGSMMNGGMTNGGGMKGKTGNGDMTDMQGMMPMMAMMSQMTRMMENCNTMMETMIDKSGKGAPNAQSGNPQGKN